MLIDKLASMCYNNNSKRDKAKTKLNLYTDYNKRGEKSQEKNFIVWASMTV